MYFKKPIFLLLLSSFSYSIQAQTDSLNAPPQTTGWGGFTLVATGYQGNLGLMSGGMGGISQGNLILGGFGYGGSISSNTSEAKSVDLGIGGVFLGYKKNFEENFNLVVLARLGYGGGRVVSPLQVSTEFGVFRSSLSAGISYEFHPAFALVLLAGYDYNLSTSDNPDIARNLNALNLTLGIVFGRF